MGWGGGEYQYPLAARWRLRTGINVNHREYKGGRFDQTFGWRLRGAALVDDRNTEMSLLATASQRWWGGSSFNYDYGARLEVEHRVFAGLRLSGRALWSDREYQQQRSSWKGRSWCSPWARILRALPDRAGQRPWWAISSRIPRLTPGQCRVLDAGGHERGLAVGLYRGRQRRVPVDELRETGGDPFTPEWRLPARTRPASCRPRC